MKYRTLKSQVPWVPEMRKPREIWRLGEGEGLEGRGVTDAAGRLEGVKDGKRGHKVTGGNKNAAGA